MTQLRIEQLAGDVDVDAAVLLLEVVRQVRVRHEVEGVDLHGDLRRFEDSRPVYARIRQTGRDWSGRAALAAAHGATETPHTLRPPEARGQALPLRNRNARS